MGLHRTGVELAVALIFVSEPLFAQQAQPAQAPQQGAPSFKNLQVLPKEIDRRELMEAAIRGMLTKLDAHSSYIPPAELDRFSAAVTIASGSATPVAGVAVLAASR